MMIVVLIILTAAVILTHGTPAYPYVVTAFIIVGAAYAAVEVYRALHAGKGR
jgi:hypothetical protein